MGAFGTSLNPVKSDLAPRGFKTCPGCKSTIPETHSFCAECGYKQPLTIKLPVTQIIKRAYLMCPGCNQLRTKTFSGVHGRQKEAKFCFKCGTKLVKML
jgi:rRNA maturation endonuclease Nob1